MTRPPTRKLALCPGCFFLDVTESYRLPRHNDILESSPVWKACLQPCEVGGSDAIASFYRWGD